MGAFAFVALGVVLGVVAAWLALNGRGAGTRAQLGELQRRLGEASAAMSSLRDAKERLGEERAGLVASLDLTQVTLAGVMDEREKLRAQVDELLPAKATLQQKYDSLNSDRAELGQVFRGVAQEIFSDKEKAIQGMVDPIQKSLKELGDRNTQLITKIDQVSSLGLDLKTETNKLATALSSPTVSGKWGDDVILARVVSLAGMTEHCDFDCQVRSIDNSYQPDMIVSLPNGRKIIVDSKTSVKAYQEAYATSDAVARGMKLAEHARQVKAHISQLAKKRYDEHFQDSLDLVVCFIPGDVFHAAALSEIPDLWEFAAQQNILLATPTTLLGLLKAAAYGWRQDALTREAAEIKRLGQAVYERLTTAAHHLDKLRKSIESTVSHWNALVGSFESNTLPAARRMRELGIHGKEIDIMQTVDNNPRQLDGSDWNTISSLAAGDAADETPASTKIF
jgi:DNA recombination protein RmuC